MSRSPSPSGSSTPFLIRTFVKQGPGFHPIEDFEDGLEPLKDEYALWAWPDSTIQHVVSLLVASAFPPAFKNPSCRYSIRMLFYEQPGSHRSSRGAWKTKEVGLVHGKELGRQDGGQASARTLDGLRFNPGDYLLISVLLPGAGTGPAPASLAIRGSAPGSRPSGSFPPRHGAGMPAGRDGSRLSGGVGAPPGDESWIDARAAGASRQGGGRGRSRSPSPVRRDRGGRRRSSPTFRDRDRNMD